MIRIPTLPLESCSLIGVGLRLSWVVDEAMSRKALSSVILLAGLLFVSCSEDQQHEESGEAVALTRATELVSELNQSIESDYPLAPAAWNGVPVVILTVESADFDYQPTVESIVKAVGSFEGDLQVAVQTPMEISDAERASRVKDAKFIVAHFDARTGERIP